MGGQGHSFRLISMADGRMMKNWLKRFSGWRNGFVRRRRGTKLLIGLITWAALFFFVHLREAPVEILKLHSRAKHRVVAPIDFEFPDHKGTAILQQESMRDIGIIYQISPQELDDRRFQLDDRFLQDQSWRSVLPEATFEELYQSGNAIKNLLSEARFANVRTLQRLASLNLFSPNYRPLPANFDGHQVVFPTEFWAQIQKTLTQEEAYYKASCISYILRYFQHISWSLEKAPMTQKALKQLVKVTIPPKMSKMLEGTRILEEGDLVTQYHVEVLTAMKKVLAKHRKLWNIFTCLSNLCLALLILCLGGGYLRINHPHIFSSPSKLSLFVSIVILTMLIAKSTEYLVAHHASHLLSIIRYPLFIPFAALLLSLLLNMEVALLTTCLMTIVFGMALAVDALRFITINLVAGMVTILASRQLRRRKEVFVVYGKSWASCFPVLLIFNFLQHQCWDHHTLYDGISTFFFLMLTAILVVGILPIFESIFHLITDMTLIEYMDPSNELLRRLSIEAPGTYQHCLVVGSIAEAAAQAIGANGLFCRVSALYHDIGKLSHPHYFTENQLGGFNIHQLLTPSESAHVIISHVDDGETLARRHGLPEDFIHVIQEHHGTTLVYYFFCRQVEQTEGDVDAVDEEDYRYKGPAPRSKESAIIMIADTVEAASRSLEDVNEDALSELVDRLVGERLEDGQFSECALTFKEFETVKHTMVKMLAVARHLRIKYPAPLP